MQGLDWNPGQGTLPVPFESRPEWECPGGSVCVERSSSSETRGFCHTGGLCWAALPSPSLTVPLSMFGQGPRATLKCSPLQPFEQSWGAVRQLGITLPGIWILPGQRLLIVLCLNPKRFSPELKALCEHNLQVQTEENLCLV